MFNVRKKSKYGAGIGGCIAPSEMTFQYRGYDPDGGILLAV
jgi:hypothetical protein